MSEIWKTIPWWPTYEISDQGNCRSLDRVVDGKVGQRSGAISHRLIAGRRLTPRLRPDGTPCFNLWRGNGYVQVPARRLVMIAFVSSQPPGMDAVNIDGDVTNNRLSNLKWGPTERARSGSVRRLLGQR